MFMRTVQQNVFLILNSVSVTAVTDPELIRPSIPVMTHSLDQKVVASKAKARKCAAEVAGNVQAMVERQHRLLISFSVIPPSRNIFQRYTEMCVICPHNSAIIPVWDLTLWK
jgi:SET domain-containing protein